MRLISYLFCLLLFFPLLANAQSNYKPGLVVTLQGDTLHGFIDYREWDINPATVLFRERSGMNTEQFSPANARYFEITGLDAYQRYVGPVSMNPVAIDKITDEFSTQPQEATVFLKIVTSGQYLRLLSYTDATKTRFFYQEGKNAQPLELFYGIKKTNTYQLVVQKGYVGQLQLLLNKYNSEAKLANMVQQARYSETDLKAVVDNLNNNTAKPAEMKEKAQQRQFYAGIGLNRSSMVLTGIAGLEDPDSNPASHMPLLTVGYDLVLHKYIDKVKLRTEAGITAGAYNIYNETGDWRNYHTYQLTQQTAFLSPQLLYNFYNSEKVKAYVGLNGQVNFSRYTKNLYTKIVPFSEYDPNQVDQIEKYPSFRNFSTVWTSCGLNAGVTLLQRYELYARYNYFVGVADYQYSAARFNSLYLGLNYRFRL